MHEAAVVTPWEEIEFRVEGLVGHGREVIKQVVAKLPPANLAQEFVNRVTCIRRDMFADWAACQTCRGEIFP